MSLLRRLLFGFDRPYIAHWSEARAKQYEKETWRYLGVRPEPHYMWPQPFREAAIKAREKANSRARATVTPIKKRA